MLQFGWETFKKSPLRLIGFPLLVGIGMMIISYAIDEISKQGTALAIVGFVVSFVIQTFYGIGMANFFVKAERNVESVELMDFWYPKPFWRYVGMSLLMLPIGAVVLLGVAAIAGIVAGIMYLVSAQSVGVAFLSAMVIVGIPAAVILGLFLFPLQYIMVSSDIGPIDGLKRSYHITRPHLFQIFLFMLAIIGINILGLLALIVGLLVSIPVSTLASVHLFRHLEREAGTPPATV